MYKSMILKEIIFIIVSKIYLYIDDIDINMKKIKIIIDILKTMFYCIDILNAKEEGLLKQKIKVYGYEFASISHLMRVLGYTKSLSLNQVKNMYGDIDKLIQAKTRETDPDKVKSELGRLIAKYNGVPIQTPVNQNGDQVLKAVKNLALNRFIFSESVDRDIDSILKMYDDPRSADEIKRALLSDI